MPFITRLPALTGADPYPDALLALDFVGARRGPQYYKALGVTTADITKVPGWTYTGGTAAGTGSYAARQDGSLQFFPSYTNLLTYSNTFTNGAWAKTNATVTTGIDDPFGGTSASRLTATAGPAGIYQTLGTSVTGVSSVWVRRATGTGNISMRGLNAGASAVITVTGTWQRFTSPAATGIYAAIIDIATSGDAIDVYGAQLELGSTASTYIPTTTAAVTVGTPRITDAGYWAEEARTNLLLNSATLSTQSVTVTAVAHTLSFYGTGTVTLTGASTAGPLVGTGASNRVTLTFTPTAGSLTLTVSGSVTIAQLEAGSFATSPIPTTSVAVTRAAGVGSNPWTTNSGTLFAEFVCPPIDAANSQGIVSLDDGTASNRIVVYYSTGGSVIAQIDTGGVSQATLNLGAVTPGTRNKVAVRLATNDAAASLNGGVVATDASVTLPTVTTHNVGSSPSMRSMNAAFRRDAFYPRAFANSELQAITTAGAY